MVTIARFSKAEDAHLLRLRLEAGGVPAYLQDEHTVQTHWLYSDLIGGVRVQVAEEDLDAAREIVEMPSVAEADPERPVCPRCGSGETAPDEWSRRVSFWCVLLLGFPVWVSRRRWTCPGCGASWREEAGNASPDA